MDNHKYIYLMEKLNKETKANKVKWTRLNNLVSTTLNSKGYVFQSQNIFLDKYLNKYEVDKINLIDSFYTIINNAIFVILNVNQNKLSILLQPRKEAKFQLLSNNNYNLDSLYLLYEIINNSYNNIDNFIDEFLKDI